MSSEIYKEATTKLQNQLKELKKQYVSFVMKNPAAVDQIEKCVKASSYLVEALSKNYATSIFISEFVSSACNLFAYVNSCLVAKSKKVFEQANSENLVEKIRQFLIVIDFSQAFLELSAWRLGGSGAKWAIIAIICLVKAMLRCLLIFVFNTGIQSHNPMSCLKSSDKDKSEDVDGEVIYIGSRTGHRMKTLAGFAKASKSRFLANNDLDNLPSTVLTFSEKAGESMHAVRPLIHVLATSVFSSKSFVPWILSLIVDCSSHALLQRPPMSSTSTLPPYNSNEMNELRRRYACLAYYLLRSPFYDKFAETRMQKLFAFLSTNIPLSHYLFEPLSKYIPEWQRIYFYTWTD